MRLSIRIKMLLVFGGVLLLAVGSYVVFAANLFARDKLAYVYDLNTTLAGSLADQVSAALEVNGKEIQLVAETAARGGEVDGRLGDIAKDIYRVEVLSGVGGGDSFSGRQQWVNSPILAERGIRLDDLDRLRRERPVPLTALAANPSFVFVQNSSLAPDVALMTLALRVRDGTVAVAELSLERLLKLFAVSPLNTTYLVDAQGEVIAHPDAALVIGRQNRAKAPLVSQALLGKAGRGASEFDDEKGKGYLGAFARVEVGGLWLLTEVERAAALAARDELLRRSFYFGIAVFLAAAIASVIFSRYLAAPIQRLRAATEVVGQGRFDVQIDVRSKDEIGELARAFENMARTLRETQGQLVQSEKLAAFGQLGAGITHEVKNPMTGIVGFAQLAQRRVQDPEKTLELLKLIESEALRCRDILVNFLKFARVSAGERERIDPAALAEEAARILRHQLAVHRVKLEVDIKKDLPAIMASAVELQQVILNLAMNSQQAMPEGGKVWLTAREDETGGVILQVRDNGPGVPPAIAHKIFEPFFSTKPSGEGTGLGLSVSFGIVQAHGGKLVLESPPEGGAAFSIHLPAAPAEVPAAKAAAGS